MKSIGRNKIALALVLVTVLASLVAMLVGCSSTTTAPGTTVTSTAPASTVTTTSTTTRISTTTSTVLPPTTPANPNLILASTTSTQDSGLMDVLTPIFDKETGYNLKGVYVGTGAAIQMGVDGNADVLLVHAPSQEKPFMDAGWGINRRLVMHNDFVIVGPPSDPAGINGMTVAADAFAKIAAAGATFISRGDKSGTNTSELNIWKTAGIDPSGQPWYQETGQGMGATLTITSEKQGYTLTDRATYLNTRANLDLNILVQGDPVLLNIYHVIQVNPAKWPDVNAAGAEAFVNFMISPAVQEIIRNYGVDKYGQPLFFPDADKTEADLGSY
jgi:tungstate transport system substrate-binding protein